MASEVDQLRAAIGVETDLALAAELGLDRSTVAQWRRRGSLSARYRQFLEELRTAEYQGLRLAVRRQVYGDSSGRYLFSAALGVIPTERLDLPPSFGEANVGCSRESLILNVIEAVIEIAKEVLGKPRCDNEAEFMSLSRAMDEPANRQLINAALQRPMVGEL